MDKVVKKFKVNVDKILIFKVFIVVLWKDLLVW